VHFSGTDLAIDICLWITGVSGLLSIVLFFVDAIKWSDLLALIGIVVSVMPILLDVRQRRFQKIILRLMFGGLPEKHIDVINQVATGEKSLEEIARETKLDMSHAHTIVSDLYLRGFLEESVVDGKTYFRLSQLGKSITVLQTSSAKAENLG
jgi:predicted transcriptional regulator